ncbi:MAG: hypothetical protein LBH96_04175 [Candidatus Peribacteria bacterium]|nr:hypothetical protein [Candidatus Peribacteria bacterium]
MEMKSGSSTLNRNERMVKECVAKGNICYEIFRVHL